jgi:hypothetical protein
MPPASCQQGCGTAEGAQRAALLLLLLSVLLLLLLLLRAGQHLLRQPLSVLMVVCGTAVVEVAVQQLQQPLPVLLLVRRILQGPALLLRLLLRLLLQRVSVQMSLQHAYRLRQHAAAAAEDGALWLKVPALLLPALVLQLPCCCRA